jgi:TRAP-type C4-dicarboxylate transport system permease small subunit
VGSGNAVQMFRKVLAAIGFVELWVAMAAFVFVITLTMVQVLYRYALAGSIWWAQEIAQLGMLIAYFFGISYVYKAKQDIVVGFLLNRLSRPVQARLAIFGQLLIAGFCLLLVVTGLELAPAQLVFFTYILNIPRFYSTLPLIVASASMALTAIYYAVVAWQSRNESTEAAEKLEREALIVAAPEVVI